MTNKQNDICQFPEETQIRCAKTAYSGHLPVKSIFIFMFLEKYSNFSSKNGHF